MNIIIIFLLLVFQFGFSQNTEKEITIVYNLYASGFDNNEYLYSTDTIKMVNDSKSYKLLSAISNTQSLSDIFKNSGIDTLKILDRVQSFKFITDYLQNDKEATLDKYYFNNAGINEYNINNVNKNPTEWKKHEDYVQIMKLYDASDIKPSFDIENSIKTSERNNCGCNYRFDRAFIEKGIFFEITSSQNASSIWFLLPDNTLLLYHVQSYHLDGTKVLDIELSEYGENINLPWACLLFDSNGKLIVKK